MGKAAFHSSSWSQLWFYFRMSFWPLGAEQKWATNLLPWTTLWSLGSWVQDASPACLIANLRALQNLIKRLSILNLGWFGSLCSQKIKALCSQINFPHMSISFNWTKSLLEENSSPFGQWCIPPCSWYALFPSFTLLLFAVQLPYAAAHVWCQRCWWWISRRADLSNVSLK